MIIIKDGVNFSKVYADKAFDEWGVPTDKNIIVVEDSANITLNKDDEFIDSSKPYDVNFDRYTRMIENTLWIFNNEKVKIKKDQVYTVGSGINWMLQQGKVHVIDISKTQVKFVKELLSFWDGKDYGTFVYNFIKKNNIFHFHVNLNEQQNQQTDLIKDKSKFVEAVNQNFKNLLKKYSPNWKWEPLRYTVKHGNILEYIPNIYLGKFLISNVLNFKYYYARCYIDDAHRLLSPSTKAFIKKVLRQKKVSGRKVCQKLETDVPFDVIHHEIQSIKKYLYPHRSESGIGWRAFCIHGQAYDRTKEDDHYLNFIPHHWTPEALKHMPKTIKWLKGLGYKKFQRVRVMCLDPKGFINVHRDSKHRSTGTVNVAITHPKNCEFYVEDHGIVDFKPGHAFSIDTSQYHAVVNNSNLPRYHLIIHGDK